MGNEWNPEKMTFTTASGLLPAGIAVYVQRGPNGVGLEMRYPVGLEGVTSQSETRQSNSLLPAWEAGSSEGLHPKQSTCGLSIRTATGQCGLQHLHRVLALVEGGDGVDVQIHAQSVAELIGDQLRIDTGLTRKTGMRASHDLKSRPLELDGFQPRRQEPPPGIVAPEGCGALCGGKHPRVGIGGPTLLPPLGHEML